MVKHGKNKKRRSGRGKTRLKQKHNFKRWDPTLHTKIIAKCGGNPDIGDKWDQAKSFAKNLSTLGLVARPNDAALTAGKGSGAAAATRSSTTNVIELFDIPDSDELNRNKVSREERYPLTKDEQQYIAKCFIKYGEQQYEKIFRDTKGVNYMQHTETTLRKLGARFLLLAPEQRLVEYKSPN